MTITAVEPGQHGECEEYLKNLHRHDLPRPVVLTVKEACQVLRISRWTLYGLIRSRQIETITIGRSRRIPVSSVNAYVERRLGEDIA